MRVRGRVRGGVGVLTLTLALALALEGWVLALALSLTLATRPTARSATAPLRPSDQRAKPVTSAASKPRRMARAAGAGTAALSSLRPG